MYSVLLEDISGAIGARLLVQFSYNNQTLVVEPHLVGKNRADEDCMCGWVSSDTSSSEIKAGWNIFVLKNINSFTTLEERFSKARPGYDPYDNRMNRVYYRI